MFGLLKKKNPYEDDARAVYAAVLTHIRQPVFYERFGVPDSFDGRFDLLLLHVFILIEASGDAAFDQALFDATFADMDQTLREMGIGDMGVPKHMRKMMKAFNGRMHAYADGLEKDDLAGALVRNLYGTVDVPDGKKVKALAAYVMKSRDSAAALGLDGVLRGDGVFKV